MKRIVSLALAATLVCGCAATPEAPLAANIDPPTFVAPTNTKRPRVALVLSGGSMRGFAHIGVLRVLAREKLQPDLVVGTSAGAIIGALYASGLPVWTIEELAARLDRSTLLDIAPWRIVLGGFGLGLARGDRLEGFLREPLHQSIQEFPIRFAAIATDIGNGDTVMLNHGDAALALRASSAVPGLYPPVSLDGRLLADGQIVSPLPVDATRRLGACRIVAVDVVYPPRQAAPSNPISMLFQTITVSTYRHLMTERAQADLVLTPRIRSTSGQLGLADRQELISAGERAAEDALPALRKLFAVSGDSPPTAGQCGD